MHHSGNCCKGEIRRRDFAEVGGARCPAARVGWPYGCSSQCRRAPESSWGRLLRAATPCFAAVRGDIVLCAANAAGEAIGHSPSYNDLRRTTETTGAEGLWRLDMTITCVAVFGGSGFLGRAIVSRLAATGATVRVAALSH